MTTPRIYPFGAFQSKLASETTTGAHYKSHGRQKPEPPPTAKLSKPTSVRAMRPTLPEGATPPPSEEEVEKTKRRQSYQNYKRKMTLKETEKAAEKANILLTPRQQREQQSIVRRISNPRIVWATDPNLAMHRRALIQSLKPSGRRMSSKGESIPERPGRPKTGPPTDPPEFPKHTYVDSRQSTPDNPDVDDVLDTLEKIRIFMKRRSMRTVFRAIDNDRSNRVDKEEFSSLLAGLGYALKDSEKEKIWNYMARETGGQDTVEYHEMCRLLEIPQPTKEEKRRLATLANPLVRRAMVKIRSQVSEVKSEGYKILFNAFDDDGSGTLEKEEFRKFLDMLHPKLNDEQALRISNAIDENDDGLIDYQEFSTNLEKPSRPEHQILHGARITPGLLESMGVRASRHACDDHNSYARQVDYQGEVNRDHAQPPVPPQGLVLQNYPVGEWEKKKKDYVNYAVHEIKKLSDKVGGPDKLYRMADWRKDDGITHAELKSLMEKNDIKIGHDIWIQATLEHFDMDYLNCITKESFKKVLEDPTLMLEEQDLDQEIAEITAKVQSRLNNNGSNKPPDYSTPQRSETPSASVVPKLDLAKEMTGLSEKPQTRSSGALTDRPSTSAGVSNSKDSGPGAARRNMKGIQFDLSMINKHTRPKDRTKIVMEQVMHGLDFNHPTRFSARPPHANTFVHTQYVPGCAGHEDEENRLVRYDLNSGLKVQTADKEKKETRKKTRLRKIAEREDRVNKYCMVTEAFTRQRELQKINSKTSQHHQWLKRVQDAIVVIKPDF